LRAEQRAALFPVNSMMKNPMVVSFDSLEQS